MVGGVEITPRARAHAHEMLDAVAGTAAAAATTGASATAARAKSARKPARSR